MNTQHTPKILHQTWKTKNLPPKLQKWRDEWIKFTPNYEHKLYDDEDLVEFMVQHFPQYLNFFHSMKKNIERVDFWRYGVLYIHGGVYADLDTFPLKSIDEFVDKNQIILGREPLEHARYFFDQDFLLCNAFMISPKGDEFWLRLMEFIVRNYPGESKLSMENSPDNNNNFLRNVKPSPRAYFARNPVNTTGPGIMTRMYETNPHWYENVLITDPRYFYPLTKNRSKKNQIHNGQIFKHVSEECDMKDAYVVHMWENSWSEFPMKGLILTIIVVLIILILGYMTFKYYRTYKINGKAYH